MQGKKRIGVISLIILMNLCLMVAQEKVTNQQIHKCIGQFYTILESFSSKCETRHTHGLGKELLKVWSALFVSKNEHVTYKTM